MLRKVLRFEQLELHDCIFTAIIGKLFVARCLRCMLFGRRLLLRLIIAVLRPVVVPLRRRRTPLSGHLPLYRHLAVSSAVQWGDSEDEDDDNDDEKK